MPREKFHISAVYRLVGNQNPWEICIEITKTSKQREGRAVVWSVWMTNLKQRLRNTKDTVMGSGQESLAGATNATLSCTGCPHLPSLCSQTCAADSCVACHAAAPGTVFSSFFGAIMWQIIELLFTKPKPSQAWSQQWQRTAFYCFCFLCEGSSSCLHLEHLLSQLRAWYHHRTQNLVEVSPEWLGSLRIMKHPQIQETSGHAELHFLKDTAQLFRF